MNLKRIPAGLVFLTVGVAGVLLVRVEGSDASVHLRLVLACGAFYLAGGAVERLLGLEGPFVFHRIVVGQLALAVWFCARSLFPGPGVGRVELGALLVLCAAVLWRKRAARGEDLLLPLSSVWTAWWASTLIFIGAWSGRLDTPGSDTDLHAWFARLTALSGRVARTQLPWSAAPVRYPSGFADLNALWSQLSLLEPVQVVNCQVAMQACLALGLAIEAAFAARGKIRAVPALVLIALAHLFFALPVNPDAALMEGTARLAHTALFILPLTFAVRAGASRSASCAVAVASVGFAFVMNPARLAVSVPVVLATGVVILASKGDGKLWRGLAAGAVFALLLVAPDPWGRAARTGSAPGQVASGSALPALSFSTSIRGGFARLWSEGAQGCVRSPQCRAELDALSLLAPLVLVALALWLSWRDRRSQNRARSATAVLAVFLATNCAVFLAGAVDALLAPRASTFQTQMIRNYVVGGLIFSMPLLLLVELAFGLALLGEALSRLRPEGDLLASAALVLVLALTSASPELAMIHRAPPSSLGPVDREDVGFVREADKLIPRSELLLLPGVAGLSSPWEGWDFAVASARAVPLYGNARFAFFLGQGDADFGAVEYERRVCRTLDLAWLARRGVRWLLETGSTRRMSCVHALDLALPRYFEEKLRRGDKVLYRLRDDRLPLAREDTVLDVPLEAPPAAPRGEGLRGQVWLKGPVGVNGFACDRGVAQSITVELQLSRGDERIRELHGAAVPLGDGVQAECGSRAHGFAFAPSTAKPGRYRARLQVVDGAGGPPLVLADGFEIRVDL